MRFTFLALILCILIGGCEGGLTPPDEPAVGVILGIVEYQGTWPSVDSLNDLRFVAMRFIPRDTTDFLDLNRVVFTPTSLDYFVERDTFMISGVTSGVFVYSGIAQQYNNNIFSWRPVGLYEENDGIFQVRSGDTTRLNIRVDFAHLPPFPPR